MIKNIYTIVITLVALYFVFVNKNQKQIIENQIVIKDTFHFMDSATMAEIEKNADSFTHSLASSDKAVGTKIDKAVTTITSLKSEVVSLKNIIVEKDKKINELKSTINDFTSNINSKFRIFAIDSQNRK